LGGLLTINVYDIGEAITQNLHIRYPSDILLCRSFPQQLGEGVCRLSCQIDSSDAGKEGAQEVRDRPRVVVLANLLSQGAPREATDPFEGEIELAKFLWVAQLVLLYK
jgi:hypothetical protein